VARGSGNISADIEYQRRPGVQTLSVLAGLFTGQDTLLNWVATNPIPLNEWSARTEFEQAMAARGAGDLDGAVSHLTNAITFSPGTASLYSWRADSYVRLQAYDQAIADYTQALQLAPDDRVSQIGRGIAWLWKEEWQSAVDDLTVGLSAAAPPDQWTALGYRARGTAYTALQQPQAAISDYQAYLALQPEASDRAEVEAWIQALQ
jgi:tetratricopeptide (TPR) repeat protein